MGLNLTNNLVTLLAAIILYSFVIRIYGVEKLIGKLLAGLIFGVASVIGMMNSIHITEGVILDSRSVILSLGGLFGGPLTALVSIIFAGIYRYIIGGVGTTVGLSVIVVTSLMGVVFRYLVRNDYRLKKALTIYLFGLLVHIVTTILLYAIPGITVASFFWTITVPMILIFPLATLLLGFLLYDQEKLNKSRIELRESELKFKNTFLKSPYPIIMIADDGEIIQVNDVFTKITGYALNDIPTVGEWKRLSMGDNYDNIVKIIKQISTSGELIKEGKSKITTKLGEKRVWDMHSSFAGTLYDGRKLFAITAIDVTKKKSKMNDKEKSNE